jgi:2-methylisocitrate lyase-like PEP mutase family enzyme
MSFADWHQTGGPRLLPNAWDAGSAIAFADAGRPDGARAGRDATTRLVRALCGLLAFVSADIEDGYAGDPDDVAAYVSALGAAGVSQREDRKGRQWQTSGTP